MEAGVQIWPENWDIVMAFLAVGTQWRALPLADGRVYWMGLDYSAVGFGLSSAGISLAPKQWAGLQVMERAARNALNGIKD